MDALIKVMEALYKVGAGIDSQIQMSGIGVVALSLFATALVIRAKTTNKDESGNWRRLINAFLTICLVGSVLSFGGAILKHLEVRSQLPWKSPEEERLTSAVSDWRSKVHPGVEGAKTRGPEERRQAAADARDLAGRMGAMAGGKNVRRRYAVDGFEYAAYAMVSAAILDSSRRAADASEAAGLAERAISEINLIKDEDVESDRERHLNATEIVRCGDEARVYWILGMARKILAEGNPALGPAASDVEVKMNERFPDYLKHAPFEKVL